MIKTPEKCLKNQCALSIKVRTNSRAPAYAKLCTSLSKALVFLPGLTDSVCHCGLAKPIAVALCLFSISGCITNGDIHIKQAGTKPDCPVMTNDDKTGHVITYGDVENYSLPLKSTGKLSKGRDFKAQFKRIMDTYADFREDNQTDNRILIYVNGGLNSENTVFEQAACQIPRMIRDGYFPIFLIWDSRGMHSYLQQSAKVRDGTWHENTRLSLPFHIISDIGLGLGQFPRTFGNQGTRFLQSTPPGIKREIYTLDDDTKFKYNDAAVIGPNNNLLYEEQWLKPGLDPRGKALYGITTPIRLIGTPLVDGIGTSAWDNMVGRSQAVIRSRDEFRTDLNPADKTSIDKEKKAYPLGTGGFSKFFSELKACLEPSSNRRICSTEAADALSTSRITLIGHSMGTIVLSRLIELYPTLPYDRIVYMGAAVNIGAFQSSVIPILEDPHGGDVKFYNLMLHPLAEARELSWGGIAPSGSLLEWIDDMYQGPRTRLERTLGMWRNVKVAMHTFSEQAQSRMLFRVFGFRPQSKKNGIVLNSGDPVRHGDFNDTEMQFWRPEFWGDNLVKWGKNSRSNNKETSD